RLRELRDEDRAGERPLARDAAHRAGLSHAARAAHGDGRALARRAGHHGRSSSLVSRIGSPSPNSGRLDDAAYVAPPRNSANYSSSSRLASVADTPPTL